MGKRGRKKAKPQAKPEPKAEHEAVVPSEEVKPTDVPEATPPETAEGKPDLPSPKAPAPKHKPTAMERRYTVQCANCGKMVPANETFYCHHCGKRGCSKCGWDPKKLRECPNCATPQQ